MTKPDIIVSWPTNNDYPIWRLMIRKERERFNQVFVVFTKTYSGDNYEEFVRESMADDKITFINSPPVTGDQDWRNVAVNAALKQSKAEWVWFTEQDFWITYLVFWDEVEAMAEIKDVIGVNVSGRLHPCCIFAKREIIDRTTKNFGIVKDKLDHFGVFQQDLKLAGAKTHLMSDRAEAKDKSFFHFNGLSHNWNLLASGEVPNYETSKFLGYLETCLKMGHERIINMDLRFYKTAALFIAANRSLKNEKLS